MIRREHIALPCYKRITLLNDCFLENHTVFEYIANVQTILATAGHTACQPVMVDAIVKISQEFAK